MENLKQQTERTQARIDAIQEEHGSNLESEAELRRLKQLKKNQQTEFENKKKEVVALEKQAKNKQKVQEKVQKERAKLNEIVKKRNLIEERLNSTKPLDDLIEREAELRQQNSEDQAIIDATDTSTSEKEAARDRIEERIEEIARLQTQIAEREEAMPLRERVKEIFKKKWRHSDSHPYCRGRHYWCSYEHPHQRFESNRKSYGRRAQRNRGEAWLSAARAYWPGRAIPFQHRCQRRRLPRRTHLAHHFSRGGFPFRKVHQKALAVCEHDQSPDCYRTNNHSRFVCFVAVGFLDHLIFFLSLAPPHLAK